MTEPKWHPFPDEKPEGGMHLVKIDSGTYHLDQWINGSFRDFGKYVVEWYPHYDNSIKPKKKTVMVRMDKLIFALTNLKYNPFHVNNDLEWVDIEVDE